MQKLKTILLWILILMSFAAGGAKLMRAPQEVAFFEEAGLGIALMMALGVVQVLGAGLSIWPKTRAAGVITMGAGFLASVIVILLTGNLGFAAFSMLPVVFSAFVAFGQRG